MKIFKFIPIVAAILLTGCFNDPGNEIVFSADPEVEWNSGDTGSQGLYEKLDDGQNITDGLTVNLVGPQRTDAVTFTISVDTELTTAIEGVHYTLPGGTSYTIPAGQSSVDVPLVITDDNVDDEDIDKPFQLVLNITSSSIKVSPNHSNLVHGIRIICPSEIPLGVYNAVSNATSTDGCPPNNPLVNFASTVTLSSAGVGQYRMSDFFAGVYKDWYGACYGYTFDTPAVFTDLCNQISFSFTEGFGANVSGSGTFDPTTNTITLEWVNDFGDEGTIVLTPQ